MINTQDLEWIIYNLDKFDRTDCYQTIQLLVSRLVLPPFLAYGVSAYGLRKLQGVFKINPTAFFAVRTFVPLFVLIGTADAAYYFSSRIFIDKCQALKLKYESST
jgi:hypothetical protein